MTSFSRHIHKHWNASSTPKFHDIGLPRRLFLVLRHLTVLFIFIWVNSLQGQVVRVSGLIRVETPAEYTQYGEVIMNHANTALRHLNAKTGDALLVPITFQLIANEKDFIKEAGSVGENSLAVAFGGQNRVIINREAINANAADRIESVLAHELAHVYLDVKCYEPVPHWVHEGVAQMVAGEWLDAPSALGIAVASFTGGLIPLKDLVPHFPSDITKRNQAYAQAYSVTRFLVNDKFGNSLPHFLKAIRGDEGKAYLRSLAGGLDLLTIEQDWKNEFRSPAVLAGLLASSGFLWGTAIVLLMIGFWVKRRRSKHIRRKWAREEMLAAEFGALGVPSAFNDSGEGEWSEEGEREAEHFLDYHVAEGALDEKELEGLDEDSRESW